MARDISDLTDNFSDSRTVLASQGIGSVAAAEPGFLLVLLLRRSAPPLFL